VARSRTSSLWLFLWAAFVFQTFHPFAPFTRLLDAARVPLRYLAELQRPLALLGSRRVAAAEGSLAATARVEAAEGAELLAALAERALPRSPELRVGRRFLSGEVVGRPRGLEDECWVELGSSEPIPEGAPVVSGDAYDGRARVRLVTHSRFRIGAEVRAQEPSGEGPVYLTVGGLFVERRGGARVVRLAAHQPSSNALAGGLARVHELFAEADGAAVLAEGFRLGTLQRSDARGEPWLEPELDYRDGLFQVAIVLAAGGEDEAAAPRRSALEDGSWLSTRALAARDPAPWRAALKVPLGSGSGVRPGAAVASTGARLVGRIERIGPATADVSLICDPGFSFTAVARMEGREEPLILGRLTSLGGERDGRIRVRWWVRVAADLGGGALPRAARLYTGSGDPGLPGGLYLGRAELPGSVEAGSECEFRLDPLFDPRAVRTLFVRREPHVEGP
jgi:hypothetical protein